MSEKSLDAFAVDLHQEIIRTAELEGDEQLRSHTFTQMMIEELTEAGEVEWGQASYYRARGMEASGYGISEDGDNLELFITAFRHAVPPANVTRTEVETGFRRLESFLDRAKNRLHESLEEASPAFDMALAIYQARNSLRRIRFFFLTDGVTKSDFMPSVQLNGVEATYSIWDLQRLFRYVTSGEHREPIHIDFVSDFGGPVPCLAAPRSTDDLATYLAIVPGQILADIYGRYGPRLLELNVRAYLQARGKINRGIRDTLLRDPERFLAYNNGISATAEAIELVPLPDGGTGIASVKDLQIVNGGQTTASIHQAGRKDRAQLDQVFVQAKLTVVDEDILDEVVPLISRYANSQNRITEADLRANDRFHVRVEELSRTVWAPPLTGMQRQTKWFYERARGQYQDALNREGTPARQRQFRTIYPPAQKFTKTDMAKYENTWAQVPHLVSLGAQKNFQHFALELAERKTGEPDELFYQRHIAKVILFRQAEKLVSAQRFGGYRANIVTYTLAYLSHRSAQRVDLDRIWREQQISDGLADAIVATSHKVHEVITDPPNGGNITEWCKKAACWERVRSLYIDLPESFPEALTDKALSEQRASGAFTSELTAEEEATVSQAAQVSPETWFAVSGWAKETGNLAPWQRSIAYSLGRLANQQKRPSVKQATQGLKLLTQAERLGFKPQVMQDDE